MDNENNNNKTRRPLVRMIYLYLFSLVGLVLLVIGMVRFVDMGLKAFIFTKAEQERRLYYDKPSAPVQLERAKELAETEEGETELTEEELSLVRQWLADYQQWQEQRDEIDPVTARRHRDASTNLSLILIGFPLYLYHWRIARREAK